MKKINKLAIDSTIDQFSVRVCEYCEVERESMPCDLFCKYERCVNAVKRMVIRKNIDVGMNQRYFHYASKLKYILVDYGAKISTEATKKQNKWYKSLSYIRWYNKIK